MAVLGIGRKTVRIICAVLLIAFICSTPAHALASAPLLAVATDDAVSSADGNKFREEIELAVARAFTGLADRVAPKVVEVIATEVNKINEQVEETVARLKEEKDNIEVNNFQMDLSQIPPADVVARIPDIALGTVRAGVQTSVKEGIDADFAETKTTIQEQVKSLVIQAAPQFKDLIAPSVKALIPQIHTIIEESINESIEAEIIKVLPEAMQYIPDEMAKMSPEEIAAKMKAEIKPKIESTVRPEFETKIKNLVNDYMIEKVKKPMEERFQPWLLTLDASAYDKYVDQLPSYIERIISKDYIKFVVHENIIKLQGELPGMVEASKGEIEKEINAYIENTIEREAKIYIDGALVEADVKPMNINNRLMIPFRAIATSLGAEVEWLYKTRQVVMKKNDIEITLTLDSYAILVNGKPGKIDAPPQSVENRTMVPVRFIAETFGLDVNWQPDWKMVMER